MPAYIHGTDYESGVNILRYGFSVRKETVWNCSDRNKIYVRDEDQYDSEWMAIEAGQIAAAQKGSNSEKICIVRLEMSDGIEDTLIGPDISCVNCGDCYEIDIDALNNAVLSGDVTVTVEVWANAYCPYLRPFYLAFLDQSLIKIEDRLLNSAMQKIRSADSYIEEIFEYGDKICEKKLNPDVLLKIKAS